MFKGGLCQRRTQTHAVESWESWGAKATQKKEKSDLKKKVKKRIGIVRFDSMASRLTSTMGFELRWPTCCPELDHTAVNWRNNFMIGSSWASKVISGAKLLSRFVRLEVLFFAIILPRAAANTNVLLDSSHSKLLTDFWKKKDLLFLLNDWFD